MSYKKQIVLSDEQGQNIAKEANVRSNLPWLLFDFDDTLHALQDNTFLIFQEIVKTYSGVKIPLETLKQTRQILKDNKQYQYQEMLLSFIKQNDSKIQISCEEITQAYQEHKKAEPFIPKIGKEDFLSLRNKYRIGIITEGSTFKSKIKKIKAFYGVDIDGYINNDKNLPTKPNATLFHEFCKIYHLEKKPIAYIGDREDLDGEMAKNANLKFIKVDSRESTINIEKLTKELERIEIQKKAAEKRWDFIRNRFKFMPKLVKEDSENVKHYSGFASK